MQLINKRTVTNKLSNADFNNMINTIMYNYKSNNNVNKLNKRHIFKQLVFYIKQTQKLSMIVNFEIYKIVIKYNNSIYQFIF
jgi:hypothetical protein